MLGHEVRGRMGIDWRATRARAGVMLAELGLEDLDPRIRLSYLPPAIQQLVAIARAMVDDPRVLVLDEPTSSLEPEEVDRLFAVMRRLRDRGVAILFVSHFLEQVYAISDRMTVLRDGRGEGEYLTRRDRSRRPDLEDDGEGHREPSGAGVASDRRTITTRPAPRCIVRPHSESAASWSRPTSSCIGVRSSASPACEVPVARSSPRS